MQRICCARVLLNCANLTPVATVVVVLVIAIPVSLPHWLLTRPGDCRDALVTFRFVVTVFTCALCAEFESLCATTVAGVPVASYTKEYQSYYTWITLILIM